MIQPNEINFSILTEGEVNLLVSARNQQLRGMIASRKNKNALANLHFAVAQNYLNAVNAGLHTPSNPVIIGVGDTGYQNSINGIIAKARRQTGAAVKGFVASVETQGQANPNQNFEATSEQRAACAESAGIKAREELLQGIIERENLPSRIATLTNKCISTKPMENIVNAHLEKSGVSFLYTLMPQNVITFNAGINNKNLQQKAWIQETARVTGLSIETVRTICENGVMVDVEETPEEILRQMTPYMQNGLTPSTAGVDAQNFAITLPLAIKILTAVITAVTAVNNLVTSIKARQAAAYNAVIDTSLLAPAEEDFNRNGIADSQETFFQKLFTPANLALAVGAYAVVDPFDIIKDKNVRYGVAAAGIGYGAYDKFFAPKQWLVNGVEYNEQGMIDLGYIYNEGKWYLANIVSERSGIDIQTLVQGGITLYKTIKNIFDGISAEVDAGNDPSTTENPAVVSV